MAKPTLAEAKQRAIAMVDDPQLIGYIETATTVDAVASMLTNSGFSSFEVNTITRDNAEVTRLENKALDEVKTEVAKSSDVDEVVKDKVRQTSSIPEVQAVLDEWAETGGPQKSWWDKTQDTLSRATQEWFSGRTIDKWFGWEDKPASEGFAGSDTERMRKGLQEMAQREDTPASVQAIVDKAIEADTGLTREQLIAALTADTAEEAINIIYDTMYEVGSSDTQFTALADVLGKDAVAASIGRTMRGSAATEDAIRSRLGYEGDFAQNHDQMIASDWLVQIDADDNIYYIDPVTKRVLDLDNKDVGEWSPITGTVNFLTRTDARAPIGIGTGAFGTADAGLLNVNAVAGRPSVGLDEWFDLYGNEYTDIVTGKGWEQVLKEELGATGMQNYRQQLQRAAMSQVGFDISVEQQRLLGDAETELHYQYLAGADVNMFINMPIEEFTEYQQKFEEMGIGYKAKMYGRFDQQFIEIVNKTMGQANLDYEGDPEGFEEVIADMLNNPDYASILGRSRGGGVSRVWRPPAYLAPDYAELSQAVKVTFAQKLGRQPSDAEVMLLSKRMETDHRGEFDAQVQAQKLQFFGSGGPDAGTVQDVNYAARFQESFESKYSSELGTLDKIEQSRTLTQNALGSILQADRAAGY